MAALDADSRQSAILREYQSIQEAGTSMVYDMSDLPVGRQPAGRKGAFKDKHNADGSIERYKARIVAKGYSQIKGLHYDDTFTTGTWYDSLRLIITRATHLGIVTDQLESESASLNGDLVEAIWMVPPPGIDLDGNIL